eukprot:9479656-Pyramimonas_sp.AAC.3
MMWFHPGHGTARLNKRSALGGVLSGKAMPKYRYSSHMTSGIEAIMRSVPKSVVIETTLEQNDRTVSMRGPTIKKICHISPAVFPNAFLTREPMCSNGNSLRVTDRRPSESWITRSNELANNSFDLHWGLASIHMNIVIR